MFHFTHGADGHFAVGVPGASPFSRWGWAGVEAFFVVSGFIVPWAFFRFGLRWYDSGRFLVRRIVRLAGPLAVTCVLIVALNRAAALAPGFRGDPWQFPSWQQALCNLSYSCDLVGGDWLNVVFWTLAIEVQFYAVVALLVPLLIKRSARVWVGLVVAAGVVIAPWGPSHSLLPYWPLFVLGTTGMLMQQSQLRYRVGFVIAGLLCLQTGLSLGLVEALAGAAGFAGIFLLMRPPAWIKWLGTVSYSLYLLHLPIGGKVVNLGARLDGGIWIQALVLVLALSLSLIAAWIFWRWVELPFQLLARRLWSTKAQCQSGLAGRSPEEAQQIPG